MIGTIKLTGYDLYSFEAMVPGIFGEALAELLGISPEAVIIVSLMPVYSRRKMLQQALDEVLIDFVVEAPNTYAASSYVDTVGSSSFFEAFKVELIDAGLYNLVGVQVIGSSLDVALPPPPPVSSPSLSRGALVGAIFGAVSAPTALFAIMSCFAKKALRRLLLKCGKAGRRMADIVVPDFRNELDANKKDVQEFMRTQQLPRLVDTTPLLLENALKVDSSDLLGRGGFSTVFRGELRRENTEKTCVAVKSYSFTSPQDSALDANRDTIIPESVNRQMRRESVILCSLNHPNIVKIFGVVPERGWIIMEYCTQGSLKSLLDDEEKDFTLSELTKFALATASGLAYLHSGDVSIVHGDLKADNVLVRENNSICLCDFGLSEAKNRSKTITGGLSPRGFTVQWTAPEILKNQPKTKATDVYSLAMTIWEIFERKNPYGDMLDMIVINQILSNVRPEIGERVPLEFRRLVQKSWDKHAKARPSAEQVAFTLLKYTLDVCADSSQQNEPVGLKKQLSKMFNGSKNTSETSNPIRESINDSVLTQHQEVDEHEDPVKSGDVRMAVESSQMQDILNNNGTGFPRLRVFIISFANLKDSIKMTDVRVRVTLMDSKGEIMEREVCVPNSDGLNVSKDGFLAIRSGITLSSIPSNWEPGTLLLFEIFHLRGSDKRVDLKCWSFVPKEKVTNDGVFGYNLIKKPVDIKALRKYLANKFSFRGLVPYHADGGIGMKVSYEIV